MCVSKIIKQRDFRSSLHAHLFRDKSCVRVCIQNQKCLCVPNVFIFNKEACVEKLWEQFLFVVDPTLIRFDPWFVSSMKYRFHSYSSRYPGNIAERKKCQQRRLLDTISNILWFVQTLAICQDWVPPGYQWIFKTIIFNYASSSSVQTINFIGYSMGGHQRVSNKYSF